jgi:hypothetical protein
MRTHCSFGTGLSEPDVRNLGELTPIQRATTGSQEFHGYLAYSIRIMAALGSTWHAVALPTYSDEVVSHALVIRGNMAVVEVAKVCARGYRNAYSSVYRMGDRYVFHRNNLMSVRLASSRSPTNTSNSRRGSVRMYGLLGISMGVVVGAGYAYSKKAQEQSSSILNENMGKTSPVMETAPSFQISREVFLY